MGYTQNCENWHRSSLSTLILIQDEPVWPLSVGREQHHPKQQDQLEMNLQQQDQQQQWAGGHVQQCKPPFPELERK